MQRNTSYCRQIKTIRNIKKLSKLTLIVETLSAEHFNGNEKQFTRNVLLHLRFSVY